MFPVENALNKSSFIYQMKLIRTHAVFIHMMNP